MNHEELKAFIIKYSAITKQTAVRIFRETNNFKYSLNESIEIVENIFIEIGFEILPDKL